MWVSVRNEVWLVLIEPLDPNSEKVEGFYKAMNFSIDIAYGTSLFVFCDLNTSIYDVYYLNYKS